MTTLQQRMTDGEILVLDGAMGTEIERQGVPVEDELTWARALETHPDVVRQVHEQYIRAGADVITTNTYATGSHALERLGCGDRFETWNRRAVELANEARKNAGDVLIAGSVSAYGNGAMKAASGEAFHLGISDPTEVKENFQAQAQLLAASGADLIIVELYMASSGDAVRAVEGAAECGLPVWVSLTCYVDPETSQVVTGGNLESTEMVRPQRDDFGETASRVMSAGGSALLVMHTELGTMEPALAVMRERWDGPIGAYPNRTGYYSGYEWVFVEEVSPAVYLDHAKRWMELGATIVGGCCGFSPEHIAALGSGLKERPRR